VEQETNDEFDLLLYIIQHETILMPSVTTFADADDILAIVSEFVFSDLAKVIMTFLGSGIWIRDGAFTFIKGEGQKEETKMTQVSWLLARSKLNGLIVYKTRRALIVALTAPVYIGPANLHVGTLADEIFSQES